MENKLNLEQEISSLQQQKAVQLTNILTTLNNTLLFHTDTINRDLIGLGITVASFGIFIAMRVAHESQAIVALGIKEIGESIEVLVNIFKPLTTALSIADAGAIAAANFTDVAPGPLLHNHTALLMAITNSSASITDAISDIHSHITGMGSDTATKGDIVENIADIAFDTARIVFDLVSLGSQITQNLLVISHTVEKMNESQLASQNAIENITQIYDKMIASRQNMLEQLG